MNDILWRAIEWALDAGSQGTSQSDAGQQQEAWCDNSSDLNKRKAYGMGFDSTGHMQSPALPTQRPHNCGIPQIRGARTEDRRVYAEL